MELLNLECVKEGKMGIMGVQARLLLQWLAMESVSVAPMRAVEARQRNFHAASASRCERSAHAASCSALPGLAPPPADWGLGCH